MNLLLQAHKRLRRYVLKKLSEENFGTDLLALMRKDKLKSNLERLNVDINEKKVWGFLDKLVLLRKKEIDDAKATLNPSLNQDETMAVENYFKSDQYEKREKRMMTEGRNEEEEEMRERENGKSRERK